MPRSKGYELKMSFYFYLYYSNFFFGVNFQSNECKSQRETLDLADETEAHERRTLEFFIFFICITLIFYLYISISLLGKKKKNVIQFWDFMMNEFVFS